MLRLTEDAVVCLCKFCHSYANVNIIRNVLNYRNTSTLLPAGTDVKLTIQYPPSTNDHKKMIKHCIEVKTFILHHSWLDGKPI